MEDYLSKTIGSAVAVDEELRSINSPLKMESEAILTFLNECRDRNGIPPINNLAISVRGKDRVKDLYWHTHDAYSRPHFTDSGWNETIRVLVARGFTDSQITMLMMSKHIRWAVDSAEKRRNKYTSTLILNYLDKSYANGTFFPEDWDALGFTDDGCVSSDL